MFSLAAKKKRHYLSHDVMSSGGQFSPITSLASSFEISDHEQPNHQSRCETPNSQMTITIASPAKVPIPKAEHIRLNVSGRPYRIRPELILTRQEMPSLLSMFVNCKHEDRLKVADRFNEKTNEYCFDRNWQLVDYIVDYYISGSLHRPIDVCMDRFRDELTFWGLQENQIMSCCIQSFNVPDEKPSDSARETPNFDQMHFSEWRSRMYRILEKPNSSRQAQLFAGLSVFFVFTSVVALVLGSMPEFQADGRNASLYHRRLENTGKFSNPAAISQWNSESGNGNNNITGRDWVYQPTDNPSHSLVYIEYVCIGWFTLEYTMRFINAPNKRQFAIKALNLIDLCTILPFYLEICLPLVGINTDKLQRITGAMLVIRVLRVLRMARVFKLARYSRGLQIFGNTLRSSMAELSMLGMFLLTGIIFFSTIMYFLEKDEPGSDFSTIPAACWWCVVTMTTIGYGDSLPQTAVGKLVATSASICGIIVLAFPISMIVEKFATAQQRSMEEEKSDTIVQTPLVPNHYAMHNLTTATF